MATVKGTLGDVGPNGELCESSQCTWEIADTPAVSEPTPVMQQSTVWQPRQRMPSTLMKFMPEVATKNTGLQDPCAYGMCAETTATSRDAGGRAFLHSGADGRLVTAPLSLPNRLQGRALEQERELYNAAVRPGGGYKYATAAQMTADADNSAIRYGIMNTPAYAAEVARLAPTHGYAAGSQARRNLAGDFGMGAVLDSSGWNVNDIKALNSLANAEQGASLLTGDTSRIAPLLQESPDTFIGRPIPIDDAGATRWARPNGMGGVQYEGSPVTPAQQMRSLSYAVSGPAGLVAQDTTHQKEMFAREKEIQKAQNALELLQARMAETTRMRQLADEAAMRRTLAEIEGKKDLKQTPAAPKAGSSALKPLPLAK